MPLSPGVSSVDAGRTTQRRASATSQRAIALWLLVCCALLYAMIVVGGVTRLTHSGLSIVEWQPIVGAVPPLSEAQWQETFAKYQRTPEYQKVNQGMSLAAFKGIFWWEYSHRLLGRVIGIAFLLPFLYFPADESIEQCRFSDVRTPDDCDVRRFPLAVHRAE